MFTQDMTVTAANIYIKNSNEKNKTFKRTMQSNLHNYEYCKTKKGFGYLYRGKAKNSLKNECLISSQFYAM